MVGVDSSRLSTTVQLLVSAPEVQSSVMLVEHHRMDNTDVPERI